MTHAIEAFTAKRRGEDPILPKQHVFIGKTALTDHFALLAIRLLGRSLEKACADGADADARADVMMGALPAGCAFGTAETSARMLSSAEIAEIGLSLGRGRKGRTEHDTAIATIEEIRRLFTTMGVLTTLADLHLSADKLDWIAEQPLSIDRLIKNNPRPFDLESMRLEAFSGEVFPL